ncbi:DUF1854 domain-containing protein [Candidatus Poribacteria bacterium]|nr:DUF1854 domain-containing protein [Candidatus Poribacteria bacterium]
MKEAIKVTDGLKFLDASSIRIERNAFEELVVQLPDGSIRTKVEPAYAFPVSETSRYIALMDEDSNEIGIIEDIKLLPHESRKILVEELQKRYFMPKITKINALEGHFGITQWMVETSQGDVQFSLRSRYDIVTLGNGRILIKDADGNRYEIENYNKLDPKSLALLETQM